MEKSGSGYSKPPACRFYNQLQFLQDCNFFVSNRTTHSNIQVSGKSPDTLCWKETTIPGQPIPKYALPDLTQESSLMTDKQPITPNADHPPGKQNRNFPILLLFPKEKGKLNLIQLSNS